ncbi:MAG: hypothetical protein L3J41_11145 [Melioribacteraceae bacterium]|nr:hypothetical protein [Melioribacteraceae bacterium]
MKKILLFAMLSLLFVQLAFAQQEIDGDEDYNGRLRKPTTSVDDAFGILDKGELINCIGNQGVISDTYYQNVIYNFRWPKSLGLANIRGTNATDDVSILFAHKGNVLDAYTRYRNEDFQAPVGARGHYHADDQPDNLLAPDGAPRLAHSDIPVTWPKGFMDTLNIWYDAPTENYKSLSENDKILVDSKGAFYDEENDVWRFWPGKFRIEVDPESPDFGKQVPGEFAADREVFAIYTDHNAQLPSKSIGISVKMQALSYGRRFAEDIHFYDFLITNTSGEILDSCWFGYYVDFQFGDSGDETWGTFNSGLNPNGNDNVFYQFDYNGPNPGNLEDGVIGMVVFAAPKGIGVTDSHFFEDLSGSITPGVDKEMWPVIISNPEDPNINAANYFHGSNQKFDDYSLTEDGQNPGPKNWTNYVTSGPFTMATGETVRATIAFIAEKNLLRFKKNVASAQELFVNEFNGPAAPPSPNVYAEEGDARVTIYWDDISEHFIDHVSKKKDFEGYKVYRSQDQGSTWGDIIKDSQGNLVGYVPIAQFDIDNLVQGVDPFNHFNFLGSNTGIFHYFVDSTALNGVHYSYTVTAYDSGSVSKELESLESSKGTTAADANLVDATPRSNAIGYTAGTDSLFHAAGIGNSDISIFIGDASALTGDSYLLTFNKNPADSFIFSNLLTGELLTKVAIGTDEMLLINGIKIKVDGDSKTGELKNIVDELGNSVDNSNNPNEINNWFVNLNSVNALGDTITQSSKFEIRFTYDGSYASGLTGNNKPLINKFQVPYEVWNVARDDNNYQINSILLDDNKNGELDLNEEIRILNVPYKENDDTVGVFSIFKWYYNISIDAVNNGTLPDVGQLFTLLPYSQLNKSDSFYVYINKPFVNSDREIIKSGLEEVRVVPNPYVVNARWEQLENNRRLRFMYLPEECTISIYTIVGELVKKIEHNNGVGDEDWNLTNESGVEVAFGVYLYVIETPSGEKKIGKFAIIK